MSLSVVLFTASWCKKCKEESFLKVIDTVKKTYSVFEVDIDDEEQIEHMELEEIPTSVPCVLILKDKLLLETLNGQSGILDNLEMNLTTY